MQRLKAKIEITGDLELLTGLHIGTNDAYAAIGATDSPVMRDSLTNKPLVPGSSLKGKMRTLLAKTMNKNISSSPNEDEISIRRLFGDSGDIGSGRLIFRDSVLNNQDELQDLGVETLTEVKFENTINRITSVANPRQIERVVSGSKFGIQIIYDVLEIEELKEDFEVLKNGFKLLELDYLGGHGSRGYGRVRFNNLNAECVFGTLDDNLLLELNQLLSN